MPSVRDGHSSSIWCALLLLLLLLPLTLSLAHRSSGTPWRSTSRASGSVCVHLSPATASVCTCPQWPASSQETLKRENHRRQEMPDRAGCFNFYFILNARPHCAREAPLREENRRPCRSYAES
ncbi:hypothetical protein DFH11DRAFT_1628097 [Phellopilus nigrolimitatus]|nr:hypothetical protein DFH11DRAFT_1628097 [Phellopilus nigrolimitatus]